MGREQGGSTTAAAGARSAAVQGHKRRSRYGERGITPPGLVAKKAIPKLKHKTIFEWAENTDKKKKLEIEVTNNKIPRPGFTLIPIGNPELTNVCKEISRETGALVYIVSATKETSLTDLSDHVHRLGYHFRTQIVEEAIARIGGVDLDLFHGSRPKSAHNRTQGDPIPNDQEEINKQADAAIRDLFPRIPNTDREMIVRHAFQKGAVFNGKPVVGLQEDLTLSRRVQLAVIAHIRHTHTRYDLLLRETTWPIARKTVEALCLDVLVKWRGDEETGRDQLDEVLREIVVIDDSDDEEEEDDEESADELEEGEVSEKEQAVQEKVSEVITITSSPVRPSSSHANRNTHQNTDRVHPANNVHNARAPAISSRTRSKTQPKSKISKNKTKKMRRRQRERERAWQEALNRRNQPSPRLNTTMNQLPSTATRQMMSPHSAQQDAFTSSVNPNTAIGLQDRPYNQAIYAIDDRPYQSRPRRLMVPSSHAVVSPAAPFYGEQVIMRPRVENARTMDQGYAYDLRPSLSRQVALNEPRIASGFMTSPSRNSVKDKVLPSIEQPTDFKNERANRKDPPSPGRRPQVTYSNPEAELRVLPPRSNIVYVDDYEQRPKRQRLVSNQEPVSISSDDGYGRQLPRPHYPSMRDDESTHYVRVRRLVDGVYREELLPVIEDDGRQLGRVIRRVPESEVFSRERPDQLPVHVSRRDEDQSYSSNAKTVLPMEYLSAERVMLQDYPSHASRSTLDSSNHLSTFPNHSQSHYRSHEMNQEVVSHASSRRAAPESRFPSARHAPQVGGIQSSLHFATQRLSPDNPEGNSYGIEARLQQTNLREKPQDEQRFVPVDRYGRVLEQTLPLPARDINTPIYYRTRKDEVIVLD